MVVMTKKDSHFPGSEWVFCFRLLHVEWSPQKWNVCMIIKFRDSTKDMNKVILWKYTTIYLVGQ